MPEQNYRTLFQLTNYLKGLIDEKLLNKGFWLKAEISQINFSGGGHCYLELSENKDGQTIAKCSANIWRTNIQNIRYSLGEDFNNILKKGSEILCFVEVTFDNVYGLKINISDVDKTFALGELEKKKQETIKLLTEQGLINTNKQFSLPIVIQNIGIIGSPNTSGHTDFLTQLRKNEFGYEFNLTNYTCSVQGLKAEGEIINAISESLKAQHDIIVIIRGGGSKLDLEVFNSYDLSKSVALYPKAVLTGIGHETDTSVVDMVANTMLKTPSALAAYIVEKNREYEVKILRDYQEIRNIFSNKFQLQKHRINQGLLNFKNSSISYTQLRRGALHKTGRRITAETNQILSNNKEQNSIISQNIKSEITTYFTARKNRQNEILQLCTVTSINKIEDNKSKINHSVELLDIYSKRTLTKHTEFILQAKNIIPIYHPDNTLKRGFSISRKQGEIIGQTTNLTTNDKLEIELVDKYINVSVINVKEKKSKWKTLITKVLQKS